MSIKVGQMPHDMRIFVRIVGVRSTKQSVSSGLRCFDILILIEKDKGLGTGMKYMKKTWIFTILMICMVLIGVPGDLSAVLCGCC